MTVANNYSPTRQIGNGVTTAFSFNFKVVNENQVVVYERDANDEQTIVDPSAYSVSLTNSGGMVTFDTAPAVGVIIAITRDTPQTQETPYKTSQGFPAAVVEGDFDKLTMMVQELQQDSDRSVKVDVTSSTTPEVLINEVERVYSSIDNIDTVADDITSVNTVAGVASNVTTVAGISSDVTAVAGNATNITAVAGNTSNINAVSADLTNVDTVATNISDVNAVGQSIANVNSVAGDLTNIDDLVDDLANVDAVAGDLTNIDAVAGNLTNIDAVNSNKTNIDTVATNISDVNAVGQDITKVTAVADDLTNIDDVADDLTNVDTVATNISDVSAVANVASDVADVADALTDIATVVGDLTNIDTVATNISDVNSVGQDIAKVTAVADDLTAIAAVNANKTNIDAVAADLANIDAASSYAAEAKRWAIGDPSEPSGNSAKWWAEHSGLPDQTGQSGKFLTTDGSGVSWADVDALPDQTGQSGKYLTTDGSTASWNTLNVDADNKSITRNSSDQLQTIGVINQNDTTTALKVWSGDEADLPAIKDANTFYATEETVSVSLLEALYPVGSVYITTNAACPLSTLIAGSTWVQETSRVLVDKGSSGTEWWELYNDGWCVQGGEVTGLAVNTYGTVNLLKAFANTNYNITTSYQSSSASYPNTLSIAYYDKSTNSFKIGTRYITDGTMCTAISWQACGYTSTTTTHKRFRRTA